MALLYAQVAHTALFSSVLIDSYIIALKAMNKKSLTCLSKSKQGKTTSQVHVC